MKSNLTIKSFHYDSEYQLENKATSCFACVKFCGGEQATAGLTNHNDGVSHQNLKIAFYHDASLSWIRLRLDINQSIHQSVIRSHSEASDNDQKHSLPERREIWGRCKSQRTRALTLLGNNQSEIKTETSSQNVQHLFQVKHQLSGSLNHEQSL